MVGEPGEEVGGPVAARTERQPRGGLGAAFLGDQPFVLGLVGDLGREGFEQPAAEATQLARSELCGLLDQVRLSLDPQVVVQVVGQVVQRLDDDVGLGQVDPAPAHACAVRVHRPPSARRQAA